MVVRARVRWGMLRLLVVRQAEALCKWKTLTSGTRQTNENRIAHPIAHKASKTSAGIETSTNTQCLYQFLIRITTTKCLGGVWRLTLNYHGRG